MVPGGGAGKRARAEEGAQGGPGGAAAELLDFLNEAWTPFHAVRAAAARLARAGFLELQEAAPWDLQPGGRYFFRRNMSALVAFAVGKKYRPGDGFLILGAHTDSPCPKLKPKPGATRAGFLQVACQPYGGGLWHTWFDRDLGVAGRVLVRQADGTMVQRLLKIERPIMRIPTLAIHLNRNVNSSFEVNFQNHMLPVLASAPEGDKGGDAETPPGIIQVVAQELGCLAEDILDFDLQLCDTQPSAVGGMNDEFIYSGRLDNLCMSFLCLKSLIDTSAGEGQLDEEACIRSIALFDHEECGSVSADGAGSSLIPELVRRVSGVLGGGGDAAEILARACRASYLVSADMSHSLHPNYMDKHCPGHQIFFGKGVVIKHNVNQRYATNSLTATLFRECGRLAGVPVQDFVVKSDLGCGSTIGPTLSANLSVRTVDVGIPQLSMHSIREMCGVEDVEHSYKHFVSVFENFSSLDTKVLEDPGSPPAPLAQ